MTTRTGHERDRGEPGGPLAAPRRLLVAADRTPIWDDVIASLEQAEVECVRKAEDLTPAALASHLARPNTVLIVDLAPDPARGMALLTTCRQRAPNVPVVAVADNPSIDFSRRIRLSGVFYLALHPVTAEEICGIVANAYECLARHRSEASRSRAKRRVLVVDDDADFLASISMLLESQGYGVSCARSARQALDTLRAEPPDLIVLDVMMEYDSAGYEVNTAVKFGSGYECFRHIPILMVSSIDIDPATRFHMAGEVDTVTPDRYLTKPVDVPTFLEAVKTLLGEQTEPAPV
jgi:DNA-binding NtrC family response regulator